MKKYLIIASVDGVDIDFTQEINSDGEPDFYQVYDLCMEHGCPFFHVSKLDKYGEIVNRVVLEN